MDFLRNQLARIRQQLSGLTLTQKLLAGSLVIIIIMTLYGWGVFASRPEMEPLLNQSMTEGEIAGMRRYLASNGISYRVVGDRIYVPVDRKYEVLAELGYAELLPRDTRSAFDEIASKISIFAPHAQQLALLNHAKQTALEQVLRHLPRVRYASVILDPTRERGPNAVEPSATVTLTLRSSDPPDRKLINAAADIVAGAVANLRRDRVSIVINGVSYRARSLSDPAVSPGGDDYLDLVQRGEQLYRDRLYRQLSMIEGVMISVSVKPNLGRKETVAHEVDPKNVLSRPLRERTETEESKSSEPAGEPGLVTNAPLDVQGSASASGTVTTNERTETDFYVDASKKEIRQSDPGGDVDVVSASVLIPRSHFVMTWKKQTRRTDQEPDDATLKPFVDAEISRLKPAVVKALGLANADAVHMDVYTDLLPLASAGPQAASTAISAIVTEHLKEVSLGALALLSLFMVFTIVRKGTPPPIAEPAPPPKPPSFQPAEQAVGEAAETNPVLDGIELDEESAKAQQMLGQVSNLVGENPDAAASLIKRWLNQS